MGRLDNKVAIVTGGAMGIGKDAAEVLAREGAKVAIGDINEKVGEETTEAIRKEGGEVFFQKIDVSVSADVERLVNAAVDRYGKLDVLVNNVGVATSGSAADISEEDWNRGLNVNLSGVWRGMNYAIPHMIKNGKGSIINTSSVQSLVGFHGWAGYAASNRARYHGFYETVVMSFRGEGRLNILRFYRRVGVGMRHRPFTPALNTSPAPAKGCWTHSSQGRCSTLSSRYIQRKRAFPLSTLSALRISVTPR